MAKKTTRQQKGRVRGQPGRPRLSVFRSNRMIYAQIIDDQKRKTLAAVSEKQLSLKSTKTASASGQSKTERARLVGKALAQKALKAKVNQVVFDRGKRPYHGRIKALAEGAREDGLKF